MLPEREVLACLVKPSDLLLHEGQWYKVAMTEQSGFGVVLRVRPQVIGEPTRTLRFTDIDRVTVRPRRR